jgi:hypothetical protein
MLSNGSIESVPHTTFYVALEYSATASGVVNTGIAWATELSTTPNAFNMTPTVVPDGRFENWPAVCFEDFR